MSLITTPEFYINQKSIPDEKSSEYRTFFLRELEKITYGVTINGVYIHGWLYFHLNHWHINKDMVDPRNGDIRRIFGRPDFRDNEWIIAEHLRMAEEQKKGLMIFGSRRISKSVTESSWIGRGATIYEGSENVISSTNAADLGIVTGLIDKGMNALHPFFKHPRISDNWSKEVIFGVKEKKSGQRHEFSKIAIRNLNDGLNTEAFAGLTPKTLIIDEALEENSLIYKEDEVIKIKDLTIGDKIYDDSGKLTTVTDKIDVGIKQIYRLKLRDGREVECCASHLWRVYNGYTKKYNIYTMDELYNKKLFHSKKDNRVEGKYGQSFIHFIDNNSPIQYKEKKLPIDPYFLGLWLGDGTKTHSTITNIDDEIIEYIKKFATSLDMFYTAFSSKSHGIVGKKGSGGVKVNKLLNLLKEHNLFRNKHIPDIYMKSSVEQRLALIQGLMDSDGTCSKNGNISFSNTNLLLIEGITNLARSLGITTYITTKYPKFTYKGEKRNGQIAYNVTMYTDLPVFRLSRKTARTLVNSIDKKRLSNLKRVPIISIEKTDNFKQAYCIKVDNESKLFLTTNYFVTHNCGKKSWGEAFESAKPSFTSPFGWRCVPIVSGTGGTLSANSDAEKYFTNPESHNFLPVHFPNKKKTYGLFISGLYRMEGKVKSKFGEYITKETGILIPANSELNILDFKEKSDEKSREVIQLELDAALKDKDAKAYLKQRMYFPEDPDDCFLTDDGNDFPIDALKEHLTYLETANLMAESVILYRKNDNTVEYKTAPIHMKPIIDFPVTNNTFKDAPVVIYEHPMENPPTALYIAGSDPYNTNSSKNSESLGSTYIYKRLYDPAGGTFQDTMVASYVARPDTMKEWHQNVEMLLEYYNATCLPENEGGTFIQYFDQKNKGHMLVDGYSFLKTITPNTSVGAGRTKGLPATVGVINFCMNLLLEYTKEEIQIGTHEDTGMPIIKMGLVRILDPVLLREMIGYNKKDGNYDRIVAFRHALACNVYYNKIYPVVKFRQDQDNKPSPNRYVRSPFLLRPANPF